MCRITIHENFETMIDRWNPMKTYQLYAIAPSLVSESDFRKGLTEYAATGENQYMKVKHIEILKV